MSHQRHRLGARLRNRRAPQRHMIQLSMVEPAPLPTPRPSGFTLIEVMIAVSIASVVMLFVFNIQFRMTDSFGIQSRVSDLQFTLQSVQAMIDRDAKQAGVGLPNGFRTDFNGDLDGDGTLDFPLGFATNGQLNSPVQIVDGGPDDVDQVRFFAADLARSQRVTSPTCQPGTPSTFATVSNDGLTAQTAIFTANELVVVANSEFDPDDDPGTLPMSITEACVGRVTLTSTGFSFVTDSSPACAQVCANHVAAGTSAVTRAYRLNSAGYRISTAAIGTDFEGVLQRSATGGMTDDWQDIALGFIDLQVQASYVRTNNIPGLGFLPTSPAYQPNNYATVVLPFTSEDIIDANCDVNDPACNNINFRAGGPLKALLTIDPHPAGGHDIQATDITFHLFAQSVRKVGGITATELVPVANRDAQTASYLGGAWVPSKSRAIRYLQWKSDLRNLGVGY